ncbi:MAG: LysR family transcriptional regulator [Rhodobiaceae bacterium]|nr:LysR family transcriptional regulator [Rhodobiaceae bacterium]MCC0056390.1 LysR family transcriptional regulator [Rhodobiaceae bacterium]
MDRWAEIETFVRIVEAGGIGAAADRMGVAKSAVSRRLKDLESRLNVRLINRTTRRLSLTETGRAYLERCQRIMADLDEADDSASQTHGALSGRLRIAAPLSFGVKHLAPAAASFMQEHPHITLDLDLNDRRVDLVEDGFDLAVRVGALEDSSLIARKLAPVRHLICASPEFLERHGPIVTPDDLKGLPALRYSNVSPRRAWQVTGPDGKEYRLQVTDRMFCNNGDFLISSAEAGIGIVIEPIFLIAEAVRSGRLVPVLRGYDIPGVAAYALYPPGRHLSVKVRAFIDHLVAAFGDPPYWESCLDD